MHKKGKIRWVIITILLSWFAVRPLTLQGFFPVHDDTQPARVFEMAKALKYGQFPVRWVPDLGYGYGYPLFNFYAPLPYYIGASFNLLGFDAITSAKIMYAIGILLAGISMYLFISKIAGNWAGLTSAMLYMYAPYHAVNIYVRGAVGEYYAYAFLPLILLGINLICIKNREGVVIGSIGLAAVILSHNILGFLTVIFFGFGILAYFVSRLLKNSNFDIVSIFDIRISGLFKILIFGLGLSAFFTLPAFAEKSYTRVEELTKGGSDFRQHFVSLDQLWDSPWGYAGSAPGREDGMSFKIGKLHLLISFAGLISLFFLSRKSKHPVPNSSYLVSCILYLVSIFLLLEQSKFLWEFLPGFAYIQYPWRFLNFTLLSLSVLPSFIFTSLNRIKQVITATAIITLTIIINAKYFTPQKYLPLLEKDYISSENLRFKISPISDEYLPKDFQIPENQTIPELNKNFLTDTPTKKSFRIENEKESLYLTNITYFPGWTAFINEKKIPVQNSSGIIAFEAPKGNHLVTLELKDTPIRIAANAISILTLILLLYLTGFSWKRKARSVS